jgi:hypothetical protein
MKLGEGEPAGGPWRAAPLGELVGLVLAPPRSVGTRPRIVAVDGRSSSCKTSLARRLVEAVPGSCTVHTDDVAWRHSVFGWADLLADGVLLPLHRGEPVAYRPPAWEAHARPGSLDVPAGASLVVVEGVGAGRRELGSLVDAVIWVQSDLAEIERRNRARVEISPSNFGRWMAEEVPFVAGQRPWERALLMVQGTPDQPHDPSREVVITERWTGAPRAVPEDR